ncbi:hypothetical protein [Corallococcus sp. EGB]|uniref:hypothetical protein n=1 Tax=Corallococcus sp. EGB TaxID=1521117 RepID=UPI001CBCAEEB|nr:hypothetical protein [Corallococcus sp. EGB]
MTKEELLQQVEKLGHEFEARGMTAHVRSLRLYWLALKHDLVEPDLSLQVHATADWVVDWFKLLRLPPHEHALTVRRHGEGCGRCLPGYGTSRTLTVFPDGYRMTCDACRSEWLVLEPRKR